MIKIFKGEWLALVLLVISIQKAKNRVVEKELAYER